MSTLGKGLNIADTAEDLLEHIVRHWAAAPAGTRAELPARRGILAGDPRTIAWDCEQLTISMVGIGWGQAIDAASTPSPRTGSPMSVSAMRHVVLAIALIRCTPGGGSDGQPPTIDALNTAGLTFLRDAGLLSQALVNFTTKLRQQLGKTASVQAGVVDPYGPAGGYHGAETTLAITVPELI